MLDRPKAFRDPERGWVTIDRLETRRAAEVIHSANYIRLIEHGGYDKEKALLTATKYFSQLEADLLAAFWFYGEYPKLQYKVGPFFPDFFFDYERLAVEVDGRQWHNFQRDRARDKRLRELGVDTKRFHGSEVWRDPMNCAQQVIRDLHVVRRRKERAAA